MSSLRNQSMKALLGVVCAGVMVGCNTATTGTSQEFVTDPVTKRTMRVEPEQADIRIGASTYFAYGHLLERQGQYSEAAVQYEKALAAQPRFPSANNRLGITYNKLGRHEEATAQFQTALASSPNDVQMLNNLGYSQYLEGNYTEAERTLRGAITVRPDFTRAQMNLGLVLAKQQRWADAYQAFSTATNSADAHYNLAVVQVESGLYANAARSLEAALSADPGHPYARAQLREISHLASQGDNTQPAPQPNQFAQNNSSTLPPSAEAPGAGGMNNNTMAMNSDSPTIASPQDRPATDSDGVHASPPIAADGADSGAADPATSTGNAHSGAWNGSGAVGTMTPMTPAPSRPVANNSTPTNDRNTSSPSAAPRPATGPIGQMTMMPLTGPTGMTQGTLAPHASASSSTPVAATPTAEPTSGGKVSAAGLPPSEQPDFSPAPDQPAPADPASSSGAPTPPNDSLPPSDADERVDPDCDEAAPAQPTESPAPSTTARTSQPIQPMTSVTPIHSAPATSATPIRLAADATTTPTKTAPPPTGTPMQTMTPGNK